ncbi:MAG: PspA/IM30 family protein [Eubacterium sp.]|nr:PspA/IM30 family protein [Eubacterium sp.]
MGILSRFKDIMASNVNATFNKQDKQAEKSVMKYLNQMKVDLGQVKAEADALKMQVERERRKVDDNMAEQEKLQRYIDKCNENGNTSDARSFERRLEVVAKEGEVLNQKLIKTETDLDDLAAMNDKLTNDMITLESKMNEYQSKKSIIEAQEKMGKVVNKAGAENADEMFTRMNDNADRIMDRANAIAELEAGNRDSYDEISALASKYDNPDE